MGDFDGPSHSFFGLESRVPGAHLGTEPCSGKSGKNFPTPFGARNAKCYSSRKASSGSMRVARNAGIAQAAIAVSNNASGAATNTSGSFTLTP